MDIRLLENQRTTSELTVQTLKNMASRQKRREFFFRSLLRAAFLTLLFIAFGCFLSIYRLERGDPLPLYNAQNGLPFEWRKLLKELFFVSAAPAACFAVCFSFKGRLCRVCDTVFPAVYGTYAGAFCFSRLFDLFASFTLTHAADVLPHIVFAAALAVLYTVFSAVCASYGEYRRNGGDEQTDMNGCFTYFMVCLTAAAALIALRELCGVLLDIIG
jgi:hypothetical protein